MNRSDRRWSLLVSSVLALCASACVEVIEQQQEERAALAAAGEASAAASTISLTATTNAPSWPRQIHYAGDHAHAPYFWETSWAGMTTTSTTAIDAAPLSSETCNVWARVVQDSPPSGLPHSSGTATVNAIDVRSPFSASPASQSVPVNGTAYLSVPGPHAGHHCDGQGSFSWEILNQSTGTWSAISGSTNLNPASVASPTPGSETYRIRCNHPEGTHYSSPMTVSWVSAPSCSLSCEETSYPQFRCTIGASGGVGAYSYYSNYENQGWQPVGNPSTWVCKYRIAGYRYTVGFKARDSAGNECQPKYWSCGIVEI